MSVDIDRDTERLIQKEVRAGHFPNASSLVGAAVRHFLITREDLGYTREEIDKLLVEAIASLERGESVDGEEFFAALETEEAELRRRE